MIASSNRHVQISKPRTTRFVSYNFEDHAQELRSQHLTLFTAQLSPVLEFFFFALVFLPYVHTYVSSFQKLLTSLVVLYLHRRLGVLPYLHDTNARLSSLKVALKYVVPVK